MRLSLEPRLVSLWLTRYTVLETIDLHQSPSGCFGDPFAFSTRVDPTE